MITLLVAALGFMLYASLLTTIWNYGIIHAVVVCDVITLPTGMWVTAFVWLIAAAIRTPSTLEK